MVIVTGTVLGLNVAPSSADYEQGKKGRQSGRYYSGGTIHVKNGFGGQWNFKPKRLTLFVNVGGKVYDVWIDSLFRNEIGKLTPQRTKAICEAVPEVVNLYENVNRKGEKFYSLTEMSFTDWLNRLSL